MSQAQTEVSKEQIEASSQFGRIIHRCAVRIGSKTELGKRAGMSKEVIKSITSGEAHNHNEEVLLRLARAVGDVVHKEDSRRLGGLIEQIAGRTMKIDRPGPLPYRERN